MYRTPGFYPPRREARRVPGVGRVRVSLRALFVKLVVSHFMISERGRGMSVSAGFTTAEIREFVFEYLLVPHGRKGPWLAGRGVSEWQLRRWQMAVFEGDLDRGLVPREGSPVTVPPMKRTAIARVRAAERAAHEAEIAKLNARIRELEETSSALGKAIGLLHAMNEQEPAEPPTMSDPSDSSTPRTPSSPN